MITKEKLSENMWRIYATQDSDEGFMKKYVLSIFVWDDATKVLKRIDYKYSAYSFYEPNSIQSLRAIDSMEVVELKFDSKNTVKEYIENTVNQIEDEHGLLINDVVERIL